MPTGSEVSGRAGQETKTRKVPSALPAEKRPGSPPTAAGETINRIQKAVAGVVNKIVSRPSGACKWLSTNLSPPLSSKPQ
jgi:hypothetical protein